MKNECEKISIKKNLISHKLHHCVNIDFIKVLNSLYSITARVSDSCIKKSKMKTNKKIQIKKKKNNYDLREINVLLMFRITLGGTASIIKLENEG